MDLHTPRKDLPPNFLVAELLAQPVLGRRFVDVERGPQHWALPLPDFRLPVWSYCFFGDGAGRFNFVFAGGCGS
jgi:hypothetical protein